MSFGYAFMLPGQRWWKRILWKLYQPKGLVSIQVLTLIGETWIQLDYDGFRISGLLDPQIPLIKTTALDLP